MKHHQHNLPAIYRITDLRDGKVYIGQAKSIRVGWGLHRSDLKLGKHKNWPLQDAWNSGDPSDFAWDIVCQPIGLHDPETMTFLEVEVLKNYPDNFNLMAPVQAYLMAKPSTRAKLSAKQFEIWSRPELRERRVAGLRAQKDDPEYREVHRAAMIEFHGTEEGKTIRQQVGQKSSQTWASDPSLREAQSERHRRLWSDPEYREMQRAARSSSWEDPEKRENRMRGLQGSWDRLTLEERAERSAKMRAGKNSTPEERSAAVTKAWDVRRANAAAGKVPKPRTGRRKPHPLSEPIPDIDAWWNERLGEEP